MGRAARRRRRKLKEIQQQNETTITMGIHHPCVLPMDRSHIWPAVLALRKSMDWHNPMDGIQLQQQLGYEPGNAIRIATRWKDLPIKIISFHTAIQQQQQQQQPTSTTTSVQTDPCQSFVKVLTPEEPVVVQLYPLVIRENHSMRIKTSTGFKARKRTRDTKNGVLLSSNGSTVTFQTSSTDTVESVTGSSRTECSTITEQQQQQQQQSNDISWDDTLTVVDDTDNQTNNNNNNINNSNTNPQLLIEPFPTTYWLTHPLLRVSVSKLELEGLGYQLEQRLRNDTDALHRMKTTHLAYGAERWDLLTPDDVCMITQRGWKKAFQTGVAGNHGRYDAVKCLHAHTAHRLAGHDNIIGEWVLEELLQRAEFLMEDNTKIDNKKKKMVPSETITTATTVSTVLTT